MFLPGPKSPKTPDETGPKLTQNWSFWPILGIFQPKTEKCPDENPKLNFHPPKRALFGPFWRYKGIKVRTLAQNDPKLANFGQFGQKLDLVLV